MWINDLPHYENHIQQNKSWDWWNEIISQKIINIVEKKYKLLFLDVLKNSWEILLPTVISDDYEVVTTFYFSQRDRWIIMSDISDEEIFLTNLRMPWDGLRSMLFAIKYAVDRKAKKLNLSAYPQKKVPQMERRLKVLKDFYRSFWFIDTQDNFMSLDLTNDKIYEFLHKKILKYLKNWKWDMMELN